MTASLSSLLIFAGGLAAGVLLTVVLLRERRDRARTDDASLTTLLAPVLAPLQAGLERYDRQVAALERARAESYGALAERLDLVTAASDALRLETGRLASALRSPGVRGRWGEVQLRRVVELAGMVEHCDFETQVTVFGDAGRLRPDLVVRLPGGQSVVVDAKVPLQAYLDAVDAADEEMRRIHLHRHAAQLRAHVDALSRKAYWEQFDAATTPELVVLFVPGESFFAAALEHDPTLLEDAATRRVILATPTTLIALLHAVAHGWKQERIAEHAAAIAALGRELHERLATLGAHVTEMGQGLERANDAYNRMIGSLESRVLVSARRLEAMGAASARDIPAPDPLTTRLRAPQAPELVGDRAPASERPAVPLA